MSKEELIKLENQINKKKEDLEKNKSSQKTTKKRLTNLKEKEKEIASEIKKLESDYIGKTLQQNGMSFDDFKELLQGQN